MKLKLVPEETDGTSERYIATQDIPKHGTERTARHRRENGGYFTIEMGPSRELAMFGCMAMQMLLAGVRRTGPATEGRIYDSSHTSTPRTIVLTSLNINSTSCSTTFRE